jgi:hypothetical protein
VLLAALARGITRPTAPVMRVLDPHIPYDPWIRPAGAAALTEGQPFERRLLFRMVHATVASAMPASPNRRTDSHGLMDH